MTDLRKIVTLAKISAIVPMDADAITGYKVRGWVVVDGKDKYRVGDTVIYLEPDAALPVSVPEFSFLSTRSVRNVIGPHNGEVSVHILKTVKLRGQISQGLIIPLGFGLNPESTQDEVDEVFKNLGVFKYEPPLPKSGKQIGAFPFQARKTDSERVQNLSDEFLASLIKEDWYATEKIDGTSSTFVMAEDGLKVASRNWEVTSDGSVQGELAKQLGFDELPKGAVIQGEIYGEGIQKNPLKIQGNRLAVFFHNLNDIELEPTVKARWLEKLHKLMIPVLPWELPSTVDEAVEQVNGMKSTINNKVLAEGVVWWNRKGLNFSEIGDRSNFKSINAKFLLKHDS